MSDPFIGEIRMVGFSYPIENWASCDGTLLSIGQFATLYSVIGSSYGGDGRSTFALPDLRGLAPLGQGWGPGLSQYTWGQKAGAIQVQLNEETLPKHTHQVLAAADLAASTSAAPAANATLAPSFPDRLYKQIDVDNDLKDAAPMDRRFITDSVGGDQPHDNIQPCLAVHFIIALHGTYPSPS